MRKLEDNLQEKLEEIYNLDIKVTFQDFRLYEIVVTGQYKDIIKIVYQYDVRMTIDANIEQIVKKIDYEIAKIFKKGK